MRPLLALLVAVLLCAGAYACGDSGQSESHSATSANVPKTDRDNDGDHNDDDGYVLDFGHAASAAESEPLKTLVTNYFAAAAAENGARACALMIPFMAESIVENLSHSPGLSGRSCAVVLSKHFAQQHSELVAKNSALKFYAVRIGPGKALTVLSFSILPEVRQLIERRDSNGEWRMLSALDGILE